MLCRLRLSAHELEIEKGWHRNASSPNRPCKLCRVLEDEEHFLDDCSIYDDVRTAFLTNVNKLSQNNAFFQCPSAVMSTNFAQPRLAKYVYECLEIRNNYVSTH